MPALRTFVLLFIAAILSACGGASSTPVAKSTPPPAQTPLGFDFRAPTTDELASVQASWASRQLPAQDVLIAHQSQESAYQLTIYRHRVGNNIHYGAVLTPPTMDGNRLPVVLFLDGLGNEPVMALDPLLKWYRAGTVMIVPAFRGRTLHYKDLRFTSTGDACDAWDGPGDDALSLLNVVAAKVPYANTDDIVVTGYSRGGNTALVLAERDKRVRRVIAGASPVDFYRLSMRNMFYDAYTCQFFTGLTEAASRQRILASSPLRFPVLKTVTQIDLFQGDLDEIALPWNGTEMRAELLRQGANVRYFHYPYGHGSTYESADFLRDWNAAHLEAIQAVR